MNTLIPTFFNNLERQFGLEARKTAKEITKLLKKEAQVKNEVNFLLTCRSNKIFPSHIQSNVKCTFSLLIKDHPFKNDVNNITHRFKLSILNLEIKISNYMLKNINKQLQLSKTKFRELVNTDIFESFMLHQNQAFEKNFETIKSRQISKFDKLTEKNNPTNINNNTSHLDPVINLSNISIPPEVKQILSLGPKFALPYNRNNLPVVQTITDVETIISGMPTESQDQIRAQCTNIITNFVNKVKNNKSKTSLCKSFIKTKRFLKENSNIIILNSDKTNNTVVMEKSEYTLKMEDLLKDNSLYEKVSKDPTSSLQQKLNTFILELHKNKQIDFKTKTKLIKRNGISPKLYGLVKTHKPNNPMRPVVSFINSPTYESAKFLGNVLKNISSLKYNIKDSFELFKKMKGIVIPSNHILASLDVSSLFSNIPISLVEEIIIKNWPNLEKHTNLNKKQFLVLFDLCVKEGYFQFGDEFFKSKDGVAMGSPVAPIIADLVMNHIIDECINKFNFQIPFIFKFVDDLLLCIPQGHEETVLNTFNGFHDKLKFTLEIESNSKINFLDLTIKRIDGGISDIDWWRKPQKTDRYLNFNSSHAMKHKVNTALALRHRALSLSDSHHHQKNLQIVKNILLKNQYPLNLINRILYSSIKSNSSNITQTSQLSDTLPYRSVTYVQGLSEQITKKLKPFCNIAYKTANTLNKSIYTPLKSQTPIGNKSNVIYKIPCGDCNSVYIGQSQQYLKSRISGHKSDVNIKKNFCALTEHSLSNKHTFDFNRAEVLECEPNTIKRCFKEMVYISKEPNNCNKKTDIKGLNAIYKNLISLKK